MKHHLHKSQTRLKRLSSQMAQPFLYMLLFLPFFMVGCATWYQRTATFQTAIQNGDFEKANKLLDKDSQHAKGKNQILYYLNKGYTTFMLGKHEESNRAFETAEILCDEQHQNLFTEAAVLVSNPEIRPYHPEDFEIIMINYYKALNYLEMGDMEGALVEVKKINIKLQQLNDKYPDHKNRYQQDAFAHLLMGLIYDASGDVNNAFIAYRNAYKVYATDYTKNFNTHPPVQLKKDLLRTAYLCGFTQELRQYEKEFNMKYTPSSAPENGQLVFFWLNGLGPVKSEWSINFMQQHRGDGILVFHNQELGLSFPFFTGHLNDHERESLLNQQILRVAFPRYTQRPPLYTRGFLSINQRNYPFELAEDINAIAFKTLRDRMVREFSNSLLRVATKKGIEHAAYKQNDWLGFAVNLFNAVSEKADTRNWQTLPYSISYTRVPLSPGTNHLTLHFTSRQSTPLTQSITLENPRRKTHFRLFQTLESQKQYYMSK